jgi:dienelactone hydrolase
MNNLRSRFLPALTGWIAAGVLSLAGCGVAVAADPAGSGPEPATAYSAASLPTHTIYRPALLAGRYPVVLWGNGSCVNSNFAYREFLAEVASQGFIVLAIGPHRDSPPPRQQRPENPAEWPPFETRHTQMLDALDWITAENAREGSLFFGKVATDRVAAMGHSCGGLQTVKVATDPRITTAVVLNSGMMTDDDQYMIRHDVKRSILTRMHAPIAYFIGGGKDIAYRNAEDDWRELQQLAVPAINANMDVGHGATYHLPNGGPFASGPIAWLQWQLKGDGQARARFVGEDCGFCDGKTWRLKRHFPAAPLPDLTGVWTSADGAGQRNLPPPALPLQPAARRRHDAFNRIVGPTGDTPGGVCLGAGMPAAMLGAGGYPMEIIQRPEQVTIIYELHGETRRVYFGERNAPEPDRVPGRTGYSSGRWEGQVLVVETDNLVEALDQRTTPHSADARIVERYRLDGVDAQGRRLLVADVTMTDPAFYTEPVRLTRRWSQVPNGRLLPYDCNAEVWQERLERLAEKAGEKLP